MHYLAVIYLLRLLTLLSMQQTAEERFELPCLGVCVIGKNNSLLAKKDIDN